MFISLLIVGFLCAVGLNALAIILYDVREKMIPFYLILLFMALSFSRACLSSLNWQGLAIACLVGFSILFILSLKQMIGLADCLLLPSCFAWIRTDKICLFLILCGSLGILSAVFWRLKYGEERYPFTPAILFSTGLVLLT